MIKQIIKDIGGPKAVALELDHGLGILKPNAVTKWGIHHRVPWAWRAGVRRLCTERGRTLTAEETAALEVDKSKALTNA